MAPKALAAIALVLSLNLLFLSVAHAGGQPKRPKSGLILNACANVLGIVNVRVGNPPSRCCSLLNGLVDLEADACLCTLVKANVLGVVNLSLPVQLRLLLNYCRMPPRNFHC